MSSSNRQLVAQLKTTSAFFQHSAHRLVSEVEKQTPDGATHTLHTLPRDACRGATMVGVKRLMQAAFYDGHDPYAFSAMSARAAACPAVGTKRSLPAAGRAAKRVRTAAALMPAARPARPLVCVHGGAGPAHGNVVHDQLRQFVAALGAARFKKPSVLLAELDDALPGGLDVCTRRVVNCVYKMGWIPVASEFPVYNIDMRLLTPVDLVCVCARTGVLVVLEVKTGYERACWSSMCTDVRLGGPLHRISNSPQQRAHLQLLLIRLAIEKSYALRPPDVSYYVLHVCPGAARTVVEEQVNWARRDDLRAAVYAHVLDVVRRHRM